MANRSIRGAYNIPTPPKNLGTELVKNLGRTLKNTFGGQPPASTRGRTRSIRGGYM